MLKQTLLVSQVETTEQTAAKVGATDQLAQDEVMIYIGDSEKY